MQALHLNYYVCTWMYSSISKCDCLCLSVFMFWFVLQHRMRPEIARLLTPHIYEELENHPSVFDYENIKVHIFFFLKHKAICI